MLIRVIAFVILALTVVAGCSKPAEEPQEPEAPPRPSAEQKNPFQGNAAAIQSGTEIFQRYCVRCHGAKGEGDGPAAKNARVKPENLTEPKIQRMSDAQLFKVVTQGEEEGAMPSFEKTLSEDQRWQVLAYVRTLGKSKTKAR